MTNVRRAYIRFATPEDQTQGFYLLMLHAQVDSYIGDVFAVPAETLSLLDEKHITYSEVPREEVTQVFEQVRQIQKRLMNENHRPKKSKKSTRRKSG